MLCPKCGEEVTGNYCCFCGAFLEPSQTADSTKTTASSRPYTSEKAYSKSSGARKKSSASSGKATKKSASTPSRQTVKQKNKVKKKKKRNVLSTAGSLTTGSVRSVWKLFILAAQWLCSGAMLLSSFFLFKGFWISRNALGSISGIVKEHNYAQGIFLAGALCIVGFGLLQTLWMLSRKKCLIKAK